MGITDLAIVYSDLRGMPVAEMGDHQLALWIEACVFLAPHAKTDGARQLWQDRRLEAEAELARRNSP
jgi:hypothetical protein